MKFIIYSLLLFSHLSGFAQIQKGIHFQAIARNQLGIVLHDKQMQVRISLMTDTMNNNSLVYQEINTITTSPLGLFSILIGATGPMKIKTLGDFEKMNWTTTAYFIRVEIDPENKLNFIQIGQQQIQYAAYAFSADHVLANNVEGILNVQQGGTGVNSIAAFKIGLQLDKLNNTPDSAKPISKATLQALSTKLEKKDTLSLSNRINQKINKGELTSQEIESSLGFLPFKIAFGAFADTSRQSAIVNTATAIKWKDTIRNEQIFISNNSNQEPSRITVVHEGVYAVYYAIQVNNTQIINDEISIWIRRNGAGYINSLKQFLTGSIAVKNIFTGTAVVPLGTGDYIELFFSVRNAQTQLVKTSSLSSPSRPATPSAQISLIRIQ